MSSAFSARRVERTDYLASLLPTHVLARDAEADGLLRTLLEAVAGELAVIEGDLETLYDSWFIETCPEWVVPYLADLVGLLGLPSDLGATADSGVSRRAVVANTVAYRRRKGTVAVVEQVVRDVTGWPSRAVEFHRLLATTTHVNHVRLDRPAWGSVRDAAAAELESPRIASGALTRLAHTGEVRRPRPGPTGGTGRYGIGHLSAFASSTVVFDAVRVPARRMGSEWAAHPLGWQTPLFAAPTTEPGIEHLAGESDLAVPMRPRRLLAALHAARAEIPGEPVPVTVTIEGVRLTAQRIRVCGLEAPATDTGGGPLPGWQAMVDAVRGIFTTLRDGVPAQPTGVDLDHAYGAVADLGAGTDDRTDSHNQALAADPFSGDTGTGGDRVAAQVHVRTGPPGPTLVTTLAEAVAQVDASWTQPGVLGSTQVISVGDSQSYVVGPGAAVPDESRLVIVAATWNGRTLLNGDVQAPVPGVYSPVGVRPHLDADLHVSGGPGASVVLDGFVVEGDVVLDAGAIGSLTLNQCTIAGRIRLEADAAGPNREATLTVRRSLLGAIVASDTVPAVRVHDCVIDPALAGAAGDAALAAPAADVRIGGSTVLGRVDARTLMVTSSICDAPVTVLDRQAGCARFSYLAPGSRTPRRYKCVPSSDTASAFAPSFVSLDPGSPFYATLTPMAPASLRRGGEFGAEMGVHHHLRRPIRLDAAARLVEPYLPAGMQFGLFGS